MMTCSRCGGDTLVLILEPRTPEQTSLVGACPKCRSEIAVREAVVENIQNIRNLTEQERPLVVFKQGEYASTYLKCSLSSPRRTDEVEDTAGADATDGVGLRHWLLLSIAILLLALVVGKIASDFFQNWIPGVVAGIGTYAALVWAVAKVLVHYAQETDQ